MAACRVLIVSDDPSDLFSYCGTLVKHGCVVAACDSFEEGERRIASGGFDLVILSQGSRAFEGRRVLECGAKLNPNLPIVVVARCLDHRCYLDAMEMGAVDYLERPGPKDLAWVLETYLGCAQNQAAA